MNTARRGFFGTGSGLVRAVGDRLRRLRRQRGLSRQRLAVASEVSERLLEKIESGWSEPTVQLTWRIAHALGVPFSALLSEELAARRGVVHRSETRTVASSDARFESRALGSRDAPGSVEFYELRLAGGCSEESAPHAPGTEETLVVSRGSLQLSVGDVHHRLASGDCIVFAADVPHAYRNPGEFEVLMYLVITYAQPKRG